MQNITLLSFITHVIINVFFSIKKRLGFERTSNHRRLYFGAPRANAILSLSLTMIIIGLNIARMENIVKNNFDQNSGYGRLAAIMAENQSVSAQENFLPYKITAEIDKPAPDKNCRAPITLAVATGKKENSATKKQTTKTGSTEVVHTTWAVKGDTAWKAARRLIAGYIGQNPCSNAGSKTAECHYRLELYLNEQISKYLIKSELMAPDGKTLQTLYPGTAVSMDQEGNITLGY